jgi:hypothetical protein
VNAVFDELQLSYPTLGQVLPALDGSGPLESVINAYTLPPNVPKYMTPVDGSMVGSVVTLSSVVSGVVAAPW